MFSSFYLAGFECATGLNRHGAWIDQVVATGHDLHVDGDYQRLVRLGIRAIREGIRWPVVDRVGRLDFSSVDPFIAAARHHCIDVIWDLFHYGYPLDIDPFSATFDDRFAEYCRAAARHIRNNSSGPWYFTPINEPSYFSWAAGEAALFAPHLRGCGPQLKVALVKAAIQGINAIREVCPEASIVNVDPICRVVAPPYRPDLQAGVDDFNHRAVFEAWDMLCGRTLPELGGSRKHLGIIGLNYYGTNQWEIGREDEPLTDTDPRRIPLRALISEVWQRYGGDLLITETSGVGDGRADWVTHVATECQALLSAGVPLRGVCLYPILGMPEWHDPTRWARMGMWDLLPNGTDLRRVLHWPMMEALQLASQQDAHFVEC